MAQVAVEQREFILCNVALTGKALVDVAVLHTLLLLLHLLALARLLLLIAWVGWQLIDYLLPLLLHLFVSSWPFLPLAMEHNL
jgi:hypothetical protein